MDSYTDTFFRQMKPRELFPYNHFMMQMLNMTDAPLELDYSEKNGFRKICYGFWNKSYLLHHTQFYGFWW